MQKEVDERIISEIYFWMKIEYEVLTDSRSYCQAGSYPLKIRENISIKIENGESKEETYGVISSTEFDLLLPPIKRTLLCSVIIR